MTRLTHRTTGHTIRTDEASVEFWQAAGYRGGDASPAGDYSGLKVGELREEIARRNEGRDEADVLSADGKKADLVAVLEADDKK